MFSTSNIPSLISPFHSPSSPFSYLTIFFPPFSFPSLYFYLPFPLSCHILTLAHALFYHSLLPFLPNLLFSSLLHLAFFYVLLPPSPSLSCFPLSPSTPSLRLPFLSFSFYLLLLLPCTLPSFTCILSNSYLFLFSFSFPFTLFVSVYLNIFFPISFSSYFPLLPYLLFLSLPLLLFPSVLFLKLIFLFVSWQNLTFNHWISHILHFWHNCIYLSFFIRMEKKTQGKPSLQWKPRTSTSLQTFCSDVDGHRGQCVFVYSYLKAFFHCFIISQPFWYHFEESSIFIYG